MINLEKVRQKGETFAPTAISLAPFLSFLPTPPTSSDSLPFSPARSLPLALPPPPPLDLSLAHEGSMWLPWVRTPRGQAAASKHPLSRSSSITSFKDIHALVDEGFGSSPTAATVAKAAPVFHRIRSACSALRPASPLGPPEKQIVFYFTSLRVVRKTFEDCCTARSILRGFRVAIDERDLSMDMRFLTELKGILGREQLSLPQVFIGGRYIGGADEIRQLHEAGELKKYVDGVPLATAGVCEGCGGFRFILCQNCNGSHKVYTEKAGFRSCAACNENGIVRCPDCCSPAI
ncbi:uncharacterized protein At5g39865 [Elaeis guineensis]|uniref:Uncharacterized protein At5g39865 n=1 Tax=Elaeis guineensis var. tenera TaxID=51953 RepID=A0A6I9S5C4_ELAGV|nr:uncharacterized protein At5g39865 [Elaeis guineensis]